MTNRDGILDPLPSEHVNPPPWQAAYNRWDADREDLAKWEAAMAAFAPALAPATGADELSAAHRLGLALPGAWRGSPAP